MAHSVIFHLEYKAGVPTDTLLKPMDMYANILAYVHYMFFQKVMVITSTTDGKHGKNSFHYKGLAIDIRTRDKTVVQVNQFVNFLKFHFGKTLDIVLEQDHIHVEYDPK